MLHMYTRVAQRIFPRYVPLWRSMFMRKRATNSCLPLCTCPMRLQQYTMILLCQDVCCMLCAVCADAFVVVWAFCVAGVTFNFSKHLPVLGYGVRALQNLYLPPEVEKGEAGKAKQQASMVQMIKERCA